MEDQQVLKIVSKYNQAGKRSRNITEQMER